MMLSVSFSVSVNPQPQSSTLGVLFAGHSQTEPRHEVGPQMLDHYLVHFVVSGKGSFHCRGKDYTLSRGDSFIIFPGELVKYTSDASDPWCYRWVAFTGSQSRSILDQVGISPDQPCTKVDDMRNMDILFERTQHILKVGSANCDLRSNGYLRLILAEYNDTLPLTTHRQKKTEAHYQIEKAIRWLTLQYSRPISIEEMAQNIGYHRTHLSKIFKEHTGLSPTRYLLKIRMERAAQLLHNEFMTIQHIASSVGYTDSLYFSRQFKQWYGIPPSKYRIEKA